MISNERTQNTIVAATIIIAVVSSVTLVGNGTYYAGTYDLLGNVKITFKSLTISHIDPLDNETYPSIQFVFNVATSSIYRGNVKITFYGFTPILNNDQLSYAQFSVIPPIAEQYLTPNYSYDFVFNKTAQDELGIDRQVILDAYQSGTWFWQVNMRYSYIFFDVYRTIEYAYVSFNITQVTIV